MGQEVLDLDRGVVGHAGVRRGQPFDQPARVRGPVEEIGVAERDVLRPGVHLRPDVVEHYVQRNGLEAAAIHRHHRAVPAQVLAPVRGVGVADDAPGAVRHLQAGVTRQGQKSRFVGGNRAPPRRRGTWRVIR